MADTKHLVGRRTIIATPRRSAPQATTPRILMERAVAVMTESIAEGRNDGKSTPLVGAVLLKADGDIETACRGELREGDHAEFTLLERKNRSARLDGAKLFATLEPCAPGARNAPKLSCAERIVNARIKEVWIGIEDPDPKVDRKGIKFLQDKGVTVHLFDRDLQEEIQAANKSFIEQAKGRALAAAQEPIPAVLSELEAGLPSAKLGELSKDVLEQYREAIGITGTIESEAFQARLLAHGLLEDQKGKRVPTGFGVVLFGKEPRTRLPQAALLGTIHFDDGTEETRDFDGPAVNIPDEAIQWLKDKLPNPISRTQAKRKEIHETFFRLLREGIVNALVHRDYSIRGAKCQLVVRGNGGTVEVMSPGVPVVPITMEQLQSFDAPMLSRNPVMHFVFATMQLAEERGLGLKSMKAIAVAAGLPLPSYSYKAPYVTLTIHRNTKSAEASLDRGLLDQLTDAERKGWAWLVTQQMITTADYEKAIGVPNRTAKNHLKKLTDLGLLKMTGAARATRYEVARK